MKKILLAIAIVLTMGLTASAQYAGERDGFFNDWTDLSNGLDRTDLDLPALPNSHGLDSNQNAPLGSGLMVLAALGGAYALNKRREE